MINVLIYNSDLPIFPGSGAHEFLNTTHLAQWVKKLGLISMAHDSAGLQSAEVYQAHPVSLYLWKSPRITTSIDSSPSGRPTLQKKYKKMLHALHRQLSKTIGKIIPFFSKKPFDIFQSQKLFRHMSGPLSHALSTTHWHTLIVIQSKASHVLHYVPNTMAKVLVMHDIRSLVYQRHFHSTKNIFLKAYCALQAKRYFKYEKKYCNQFDLVVALSDHDKNWIEKNYHPKKTAHVPVPVDLNYFQPLPKMMEVPGRIVFTGHMAHPPNIDAAYYFATEIFPAIRQGMPHAEFFIVGKHPAPLILNLAKQPGITVTGTVPDTRHYLASSCVVVVPLRFGSGVRNKILEAWGMQKCVVTTTIGAEGLDYKNDVHLKIADDKKSMIQEVLRALKDPEYRQRLSHYGRQIAAKQHDPEQIGKKYFESIVNTTYEKQTQKNIFRVAIDLRWMVPGRAGGIEQAARAFITELGEADPINQYILLLNPKCAPDFEWLNCPNITKIITQKWSTLKKHLSLYLGKAYSKLRVEHTLTPNILNLKMAHELDVDMVYSFPGYIYPEWYTLTNILTVHDIQHEYLPEFFSEYHLLERKRIYGDSVKIARHITAISEYTRQTLIEKLHVDPNKITTIPQAADPYFTAAQNPEDPAVLAKYQLQPQAYLFFPAHTWHHKNHIAALKALKILRDRYRLKPLLICTGGQREAFPKLAQAIQDLQLKPQVRFLGYLSRNDIPALYRGAIALLYPSLFEGFGLPVLEAMSSGCPVICSNTTSLPEIAGHAAFLIDPNDPESIADALQKIIQQPDLRQELQAQGLAQAGKFSWKKHARETVRIFKTVHNAARDH